MLKKRTIDDFLPELEEACDWLNIERGRPREYVRLFEEFGRGERRREHVLAYFEAYDIVELFELWRNDIGGFPGLKTRVEQACGKGPTMTDDEKTSNSSNKPRNDAFVYLMAGRFRKAGISVSTVDGIRAGCGKSKSAEDFSILWNGLDINVECKRPYSTNGFKRLAKEAQRQIKRRRRRGIIMMDCSRLVRPANEEFGAESPDAATDELHRRLQKEAEPKLPRPMARKVLGAVLFARIPFDDGHGDPRRKRTSVASPRLRHRDSGRGQTLSSCPHGPARHRRKAHNTIPAIATVARSGSPCPRGRIAHLPGSEAGPLLVTTSQFGGARSAESEWAVPNRRSRVSETESMNARNRDKRTST